ncbi:MAG: methyltransferase domain-containing protein [Nanoarchaeota archaeon]
MVHLLFPGRHLVITRFQETYLEDILSRPLADARFWHRPPDTPTGKVDSILFCITSANKWHSRYNPLPLTTRVQHVDRLGSALDQNHGTTHHLFGIPHYAPTPNFARHTLQEIEEQSNGTYQLDPENTVVICSTPAVMELYRQLGYAILPAEHGTTAQTPIQVVQQLADNPVWQADADLTRLIAPSSKKVFLQSPHVIAQLQNIYRDPLCNDEGSLTDTRDFNTYAMGMSNPVAIRFKYDEIKEHIKDGRIVDEGCADGALLELVARDFPDSDLLGIEITGDFMERAEARQQSGAFGGTFTHFHQRNIMQPVFEKGSIDTTICNSTTHELWSYAGGEAAVREYLVRKYQQTAKGGRIIIRDVVGPENKDDMVYMELESTDGTNEAVCAQFESRDELSNHLAQLSTAARFQRFAADYHLPIDFEERHIRGKDLIRVRLKDAAEFYTKKDYTDNWQSELHEEFAFWDIHQWTSALRDAGFKVHPASHAYTNAWTVRERLEGRVRLYTLRPEGHLAGRGFPATNMVLIGEKA